MHVTAAEKSNAPVASDPPSRRPIIDECRGLAVLLMAIFHFCYDLSVFKFIQFEMNGGFPTWFRFLIVTLFFTSVGASLALAHAKQIQWRKFWWRELKILGGALFITVSTYVLYPNSWVWFGVLHFIALASLLALPFLKIPRTAIIVGILIFILYNLTDWFNLRVLYHQLSPLLHLPRATQDLTRLIPWLGMVLIGIYLAEVNYWNIRSLPLGILRKPVHWLSKHSLIFYLFHQAPLFGLAWMLNRVFH